ncbi:MAG: DUF4102 domain-containing protein [Alphaproteobacteria bacterium]|nr:DUF4102 domain-containing protein [Alphaproteobacteria bacterium]
MQPSETLWDADVSGFGCRRQAGSRVYVLKYRKGGRQRWLTVGKHGSPWTVETARREAKRLLGLVAGGADPAAFKAAERTAPTVADLCERFLGDYAREHKRPSSVATDERNIRNHVIPLLEHLAVAAVSVADIDRFKRAVRDGRSTAKRERGPRGAPPVKGGPGVTNRCLALLSKMLNLAERWGWRPGSSNPTRHIERYAERKIERFFSGAELAALGAAFTETERHNTENPFAIAAIRLLVLTGARLGEVLSVRWEYVNLADAAMRLPTSKTGAKSIYLSPPALEVLTSLPRLDGNPFVIAGNREGTHLVNLQKTWRRLCRVATVKLWLRDAASPAGRLATRLALELGREPTYAECVSAADFPLPVGLTDARIHDLRHSHASVGAAAGLSLPVIGALLGHSQPATTARYAHLAADPLRAASDLIASRIAAAMQGKPADAGNVVALKPKAPA